MALPQVHVVATAPLAIWSAVVYPLNSVFGICNFVAVLFCGILFDIDHVSMRRIRRIMDIEGVEVKGWKEWIKIFYLFGLKIISSLLKKQKTKKQGKGPIAGWINYFHTWQKAVWIVVAWLGMIMVAAAWDSLTAYLPILSYWIHIIVDADGRGNRTYDNSPLPKFLHRFFPEWLTYEEKILL